jgi:hypothetical protein
VKTVGELVLERKAAKPDATNAEIAEWVRGKVPGAKTSAKSVSSVLCRSGDGPAPRRPRAATTRKQKSHVPGAVVRETLRRCGVSSIGLATQWAAANGFTPSSIVAIVRGERERVEWQLCDDIARALDSPELWYSDWADWYYEGEEPPPEFPAVVEMFRASGGAGGFAGLVDAVAETIEDDLDELMREPAA